MLKIKEIQNNTWPFEEARKILQKIDYKIPQKGYVLFETGYGPSGLPHIGTFGEVVRTNFVIKALKELCPEVPVKLLVVSDDFDGMRKVPENVPNQELLKGYMNIPLTSIPDVFNEFNSYGEYMNNRLNVFLKNFGFEYEFFSATKAYKDGVFNEYLIKSAENYQKLMDIMIPTLGEERQATYSPFLPVDPDTGEMLTQGIISVDAKNHTMTYKATDGSVKTSSFLNGGCKLQWKCDFGMRWACLDVDYEIYGKDHFPNEPVYRSICQSFGKTPPVNYFYELFLDIEGKKISKSKGNGLTVDEWMKYSCHESLSLFMYQKPKTAKKLYFECIPKATDEYLSFLHSYQANSSTESPIFFIGQPRDVLQTEAKDISFSMLLNLASVCNSEDPKTIWEFIKKYAPNFKENALYDKLISGAICYYQDFVKPKKVYKEPTEQDALILNGIIEELGNNFNAPSEIQDALQSLAKKLQIESKELFQSFYNCILGEQQGPRLGSFISIYGQKETQNLIKSKLIK